MPSKVYPRMHARTHAHAPAHMHGARACPTRVAHLCGPRAAAAALDLQLAKTGDGPARLPRPYARRPAAAAAACPPPATILALAKTRLGCVRGCARVLVPLRASACASTRAPRQCTAAARRAARGRYSSGYSSGSGCRCRSAVESEASVYAHTSASPPAAVGAAALCRPTEAATTAAAARSGAGPGRGGALPGRGPAVVPRGGGEGSSGRRRQGWGERGSGVGGGREGGVCAWGEEVVVAGERGD